MCLDLISMNDTVRSNKKDDDQPLLEDGYVHVEYIDCTRRGYCGYMSHPDNWPYRYIILLFIVRLSLFSISSMRHLGV